MPKRFQRFLTLALAFWASIALVVFVVPPSYGQFALPDGIGAGDGFRPPEGVTRYGNIESAAVRSPIDGEILFEIASPTVYDRSAGSSDVGYPVEQRVQDIQANLRRVFTRPMDPETLRVSVSQLNNVAVIDVVDQEHPRSLVIVSVTDVDADYYGLDIDELAEDWRDILDTEFQVNLRNLYQNFMTDIGFAALVLLGMILLTGVIWFLKSRIHRQQQRLRQRKREAQGEQRSPDIMVDPQGNPDQVSPEEVLAENRQQFLENMNDSLSLERQLGVWSLVQWVLFWATVAAWSIAIFIILRRIPFLASFSRGALGIPLTLLVTWFVFSFVIQISRRMIDLAAKSWQKYDFIDLGDAQRSQLRTSTIAGAFKGMVTVLLVILALIIILDSLGIPTGSVLAITGLLGLAVSFGSQNLVKDLVNGFLILAEDQYAIGDVIDLGGEAGLVENLNLRVTQLRSADGELITLPNSSITSVRNLTRSWSRVNFSINVAYQTDPDHALSVMQEVTQTLYDDPEWHDKILSAPNVLGIDSVSHSGMTITTWIQTTPAQQWAVGRELRRRVRKALSEHGIEIGVPRQLYRLESSMQDEQQDVSH